MNADVPEPRFSYRARYLTAEQLGMDEDQVRARFPWAAEFVGNGGAPCWSVEDLGLGGDEDDA